MTLWIASRSRGRYLGYPVQLRSGGRDFDREIGGLNFDREARRWSAWCRVDYNDIGSNFYSKTEAAEQLREHYLVEHPR